MVDVAENTQNIASSNLQPLNIGFMDAFERMYPAGILNELLADKTTGRNIVWADDEYEALGVGYSRDNEILLEKITGPNSGVIKPRISKEQEKQSLRTKTHAEVFTPSWICNQMNNYIDNDWFGREGVFNVEGEQAWQATDDPIAFPDEPGKTWQDYVDLRRLEITCGEAPFICSRYDTVTGAELPVRERIGFLDRKLRVVNENASGFDDWLKWAYRAFESTYGYEFQGDNLLIARINVLQTFMDYYIDRWGKVPSDAEIRHVVRIVVWNIWQMDGLTGTAPSSKPIGSETQMSIFELMDAPEEKQAPFCEIYDWRARKAQTYVSMKSEA